MQNDTRFSEEFNKFLFDTYGIPDEDFSLRLIGETSLVFMMEINSAQGLDQLVYNKKELTWQFIN